MYSLQVYTSRKSEQREYIQETTGYRPTCVLLSDNSYPTDIQNARIKVFVKHFLFNV